MAENFKALPLPFDEYPSTPLTLHSQPGGGVYASKTIITLPSGAEVIRKEIQEGRDSDGFHTDFMLPNQKISASTLPDSQTISVSSINGDGVRTAYNYQNTGGNVIYTLSEGNDWEAVAAGKPGISHGNMKPLTREEFVTGVSGLIGDSAQSWTTQLQQILPATGMQAGRNTNSVSLNAMASQPPGRITITTDGESAVIGNPSDKGHPSSYTHRHRVDAAPTMAGHVTRIEGIGGQFAASDIKGNADLKSALSPEALESIAAMAASGTMVVIEHVGATAKPAMHSPAIPRQKQ